MRLLLISIKKPCGPNGVGKGDLLCDRLLHSTEKMQMDKPGVLEEKSCYDVVEGRLVLDSRIGHCGSEVHTTDPHKDWEEPRTC